MRYDFASIERKWQQYWADHATFRTPDPGDKNFDARRPKFYVLDMFPYPSGVGLHVGHPLGYIATDIIARYRRMSGYNVLHPMGYDAFGLPAEQFAVEHGVHPRVTTQQNIANMTRQLKRLGLSYDWDRCLATTEPEYYRWTQWIFLQMFNSWFDPSAGRARPIAQLEQMLASEQMYVAADGSLIEAPAKGLDALFGAPAGAFKWHELEPRQQQDILDKYRLAYMAEVPVNWCPALGTVLANEEVTNEGRSERGNFPVFRRPLRQWMLRITAYAERLLADLDTVDWPEPIKLMQRNWIGRSEGARVDFAIAGETGEENGESITVFTTRPDTLFGATYMVLAPEHPLVAALTTPDQLHAVETYQAQAASRSELERAADAAGAGREKTGVFTGACAINPVNNAHLPIWIADYVMMGYGTGAIMAVPAHDQRDFDFARQFGLPIRDVVYTPVLAAIAGFARHYDPAPLAGMDETEALSDYVGLCITHPQMGSDEAWNMVTQRRRRLATPTEELRNLVSDGRERRGTIAAIWRDTLEPYIAGDIHRLLAAAREGRLVELLGAAVEEPGLSVNSANNEVSLNGMRTEQAKKAMAQWLAKRGLGAATVQYKLRDWLFSRQRYWGEPFPILHGPDGQVRAVDESQLPVTLPEMEDFRPAASNDPEPPPQPPLSRAPNAWKYVDLGGVRFTREFNTMPQWAGSCWYYLRFCDPRNHDRFLSPEAEKYWMGSSRNPKPETRNPASVGGGIDLYVGGAEHAVLHLLYARFWHKVLFDLGHVSTPEPFGRLFNQGYIQAHAYVDARGIYVPAEEVEEKAGKFFYKGEEVRQEFGKMGKSLKNAITPDEICEQYGCDTLRLYEMYLGPLDQSKVWRTRDITGVHRFLQRFWRNLIDEETGRLRVVDAPAPLELRRKLHKTIKRVTEAMDTFCFNVGIAALIELNNDLVARDNVEREIAEAMVLCLSPMAPHVAEELWARLGHGDSLAYAPWPKVDPALLVEEEVEYPIQVNGRLRGRVTVPADADDAAIEKAALADPKVAPAVQGKVVTKVIVVRNKMVNIVAK